MQEELGAEAPLLVALSGYGQDRDRQRSHATGFVEHLVKPASLERIAAVVRRLAPEDTRASADEAAE